MTPSILVWITIASGAPDQLDVKLQGPYRSERECVERRDADRPYINQETKTGCMPLSEVPSYIVRVYTPPPMPGGAR